MVRMNRPVERLCRSFDAVMGRYLQALHPFMPHLTEELSQRMGYAAEGEFVMQTPLPEKGLLEGLSDEEKETANAKASCGL